MFDPSKLNLDPNSSDQKENKEKIEAPETKQEDILDNLQTEEPKEEIKEEVVVQEEPIIEEQPVVEEEPAPVEEPTQESEEEEQESEENKIIFDINLTSIDVILAILVDKEYDFATFEPSDDFVKISFRKDKVVQEEKYIKYPIYSNILIKAKALTNLTIEETSLEQEWTWETVIRNKPYKVLAKVVPSSLGSKLFIKAKYIENKAVKKEVKKTSLSQILWFLWAIAFIALVIWGWFIGFVVLNAKTVEDVKFFYSLWINLNDINTFIWQALSVIFSILIFIETIFLIMFLFKFSLTKKEFKQKKIRYWIISAIIFIVTFSTASTWMIIDKKIKSLPNWQEMAYGDVQIYDNSKLLSDSFDKEGSLLQDTSNLIWPVQIKFDLSFFAKKEKQKWFTIKKYIWDFWNDDIVETPLPTIIKEFKTKWNHEVTLNIIEVDLQWKVIEKEVENIPNINISYVVKINEKTLNNWGKMVDFDASSLKELGKVEWYFIEDLSKPVWESEVFRLPKPIFEETLVWMYIRRNDRTDETLDKLFIISGENETELNWEIAYTRWLINDLEFELNVTKLSNDFWNWIIEEFKWIIWWKEITKAWDVTDPEWSSKIKYEFTSYWKHDVSVILTNSAWETKEISTTIDIPKQLKLSKTLRIFNRWEVIEDVTYEKALNEYYINNIWVPTELKFDARFVKADNLLYTLKEVSWDYNSDGDIDETSKTLNYPVNTEWNHTITVFYEFTHRKLTDDIITIKEQIFVEWLKKEAIIDFAITKESNYVPVVVSFDASKSQVKDENIEKFIWDYWDGISEERDAVVPWHRYTVAWDYEIKLKVITTTWKQYSTSKKLILKPKPQNVKITTSMKSAPVGQWIDFSSDESEGQIIWYFWDFWDGSTSTEANPTHSYKKAWEYKVTLKLDFSNKNILEDVMDINIY